MKTTMQGDVVSERRRIGERVEIWLSRKKTEPAVWCLSTTGFELPIRIHEKDKIELTGEWATRQAACFIFENVNVLNSATEPLTDNHKFFLSRIIGVWK